MRKRAGKWTVSRGWALYVGRTWCVFDPDGQIYVTAPTFPESIRIAQRAARHYADPANVYALVR